MFDQRITENVLQGFMTRMMRDGRKGRSRRQRAWQRLFGAFLIQ